MTVAVRGGGLKNKSMQQPTHRHNHPCNEGEKSSRLRQNVSPSPTAGLNPPFFSVVHVRQRCRSSPSAFKIRDERGEESHLLRADEPPWVRRPEQAEDCERRRPIVSRACRLEDDDEETLIISNQALRLKSVQYVHQGGELASHKKSAFTFNQDHA